MKSRPILFNGPMVRALLEGSKTQTRRIMKNQPHEDWTPARYTELHGFDKHGELTPDKVIGWGVVNEYGDQGYCCQYGQPGDRLWVRETWGVVSNAWDDEGFVVDWVPVRPATHIHEMRFGNGYYSGHVIYAADGSYEWAGDDDGGGEPRSAWHPSIHMPRAASRILLEIVSVRVERLNDCNEDDAKAEGATHYAPANHLSHGGWSHDGHYVRETALD